MSVGLSTGPFVEKIRHNDSRLLDVAGVDLPTCLRLLMSTCWHSGTLACDLLSDIFVLGPGFCCVFGCDTTCASFARTVAATNIPQNDVSCSHHWLVSDEIAKSTLTGTCTDLLL